MENDTEAKNKLVQTYAEDMAGVIENDTSGLVKKIIHGEEEAEKEKRELSPQSKKNKLFMLLSMLLFAIALAVLSFFFKTDVKTVEIGNQFTPIIFNDKSSFVEVAGFSKDEISQTILNKVKGTEVKVGGIEGIYITENKKIAELRKFIALLSGNLAPDDTHGGISLVNDNFLMGVVNSEAKDFFILLKVRTLSDVFSLLHNWENKMFLDLHGFFGVPISPTTKYLLTADFEDGVIENKNARILYDRDRKIVMMYIFADDTSIVVTNTKSAAREIMLRLSGSQIKK